MIIQNLKRVANHRILAMNRGEKEKVLSVKIEFDTTRIQKILKDKLLKRTMKVRYTLKRL